MNIIAVRHTSVDVPAGFCYGQTDVNTSLAFVTEKEQVIEKIVQEQFQVVYSSPLTRCRKLAESISRDLPVIYDSCLMELNFGKWEGLFWDEICSKKESACWFSDWVNEPCPGGESYCQLLTRIRKFLWHLSCLYSNETILIVTHGGVIRSMISLLSGIDPQKAFDISIDYGSVTKLKSHE
jgi:alpha-ribazole phosphatase